MFSHQKLKVYSKGLAVVASLTKHTTGWDKRHSVVDQLCRASESIVLNLAESTRLRNLAQKQQFLDYSVGSGLECAACLDIAVAKQFLPSEVATLEKNTLAEVVRMLVGLNRAWERNALMEDAPGYGFPAGSQPNGVYFAHEPLEVYQVALSFMRWFNGLPGGAQLANRHFRQIDKTATSAILNIAEGYGRATAGDRLRFFEIAEASAVKAAAYIDLCAIRDDLPCQQLSPGVELLGRVAAMLRALSAFSLAASSR